jgi:hypothetical protein
MKTDFGDLPCPGYAPDQFDFPELFGRLSQDARDVLDAMVEAAITAESDPEAGRFFYLVIVGHSDRHDRAGATAEQRRAKELESSTLRAESARAWFFARLGDGLAAGGFTLPADLGSMRNMEIELVACGAADLVHLNPGNDEAQRRQNRRVHFVGTIFTPVP